MGMGIGIAIGWPTSTGTSDPVNSGHWIVNSYCPGFDAINTFTNYQTDVSWNPGDYVSLVSTGARVVLGAYYGEDLPVGAIIENVTGPIYNNCE
jgi:hypothetical protein